MNNKNLQKGGPSAPYFFTNIVASIFTNIVFLQIQYLFKKYNSSN